MHINSEKCVTQIYRALYGVTKFVPLEGHKHGARKVPETSVICL